MKAANSPASASEASVYKLCPRKWAFKYRWDEGPKIARQGYFAVGSKFDKIVEDYWGLGIIPSDPNDSLTQLFMTLIPIIPGPGQHRALQLKETWQYKDIQITSVLDYLGLGMVGDLKTTKDIKEYGLLTKEQKLNDMQTVLYSYRYLPEGGVFDHWYAQKHRAVELQYEDKILDKELAHKLGKKVSYAPVQPKASASPIYLTRPEIEEAFVRVCEPACTAVVQLRRKHARIDPMSMPLPEPTEDPKASPCEAYGGCEYKSTCFPRGDFSRANLTRDSAEVTMSASTMEVSVKFKIQKPAEQIETPKAGEPGSHAEVEALQPKKFTPFKKPVQTEIPAETLAPASMADQIAQAEQVVAATPTDVEVQVWTHDVPELASPATVELEVDEPTIPVEELVNATLPQEYAVKLEEVMSGDDPRVTQDRPLKIEMISNEEHHRRRAERLGRALLEILDVLSTR